MPCLLLRIGFVGELGYELHFPSPYGEYLWDTLLERGADLGAKPFGLEAQRILRLEKQHIIVGQDTDSESNVLDANMPWIAKLDKDDFVGKWALEHMQERGPRELLVGFEMENGALPAEGCQVVRGGRPSGRVTSVRREPAARARRSASPGCRPTSPRRTRASRSASTAGSSRRASGCGRSSTPKASGCARELARLPLSDAARAGDGFEPRESSPLARALDGATGIRDLSLLGKLEVRGPAVGELGADVEVLPITPTRTLVVGRPSAAPSCAPPCRASSST